MTGRGGVLLNPPAVLTKEFTSLTAHEFTVNGPKQTWANYYYPTGEKVIQMPTAEVVS